MSALNAFGSVWRILIRIPLAGWFILQAGAIYSWLVLEQHLVQISGLKLGKYDLYCCPMQPGIILLLNLQWRAVGKSTTVITVLRESVRGRDFTDGKGVPVDGIYC